LAALVLGFLVFYSGSSFSGGTSVSAQTVSCTCRYKGQDYGLGESICLKSPEGLRMATCAMVLNNTSWKFSSAPCPLTQWQGDRTGRSFEPVRRPAPARTSGLL
jgi:hypothetical protein